MFWQKKPTTRELEALIHLSHEVERLLSGAIALTMITELATANAGQGTDQSNIDTAISQTANLATVLSTRTKLSSLRGKRIAETIDRYCAIVGELEPLVSLLSRGFNAQFLEGQNDGKRQCSATALESYLELELALCRIIATSLTARMVMEAQGHGEACRSTQVSALEFVSELKTVRIRRVEMIRECELDEDFLLSMQSRSHLIREDVAAIQRMMWG
ncbi:hypothetical protein CJP72_19930 [Citrobacter sp. NCU1]|uniref:hypothetical protein n=1 Tax=Citrobacter sp. NCU1 TaxID=2026683 RepID=UPI00139115AB|nr:hypothetical protein [Citrobacter sp. NCU1]NDO82956.1 hypothetical protein [Citrobacter sp. NCU1]